MTTINLKLKGKYIMKDITASMKSLEPFLVDEIEVNQDIWKKPEELT